MRTFLRLLAFLLPLRWQVAPAILLGCAAAAANMGLLGTAAYLIAAAALKPVLVLLILPIYMVRVMGVGRAGLRYAERLAGHSLTLRLLAELRSWAFGRLVPLAPGQLRQYRSGDMLTRLVGDVEELQNVYLGVVAPGAVACAIGALTFGLLADFDRSLAWALVGLLAAAGLAVPLLGLALGGGTGRRQRALQAERTALIVDSVQGVQDILACGRRTDRLEDLASLDRMLARMQRRLALIGGLQHALHDLAMNLGLCIVLVLSIPSVAAGRIDGVYLGVLALVALSAFESVQPLGPAFTALGRTTAAGQRVFAVADAAPLVSDPPRPLPAPAPALWTPVSRSERDVAPWAGNPGLKSGEWVMSGQAVPKVTQDRVETRSWARHDGTRKRVPAALNGGGSRTGPLPVAPLTSAPSVPALAFDHVSFSYPAGDGHDGDDGKTRRLALDDVSFVIRRGTWVAVVGSSGCGKSTLLRLALRAWDPTDGSVLLDGHDIRRYTLDDLRACYAFVAQDTYLFNETLRANMQLGRPGATDDEIRWTLEVAHLADYVDTLPDGLQTRVGEQGVRLSGGERQRLAMARALLKDAPLLLLDEPTAHLDLATESGVLHALAAAMRGRTVLMATHRLVMMERMDEILVLDGGRVVERGTHAQLHAAGGLYRRLLDIQEGLVAL
jgi:ABC-type transport system involved in cytochrome bd biosynthesis fused ATPase/permease subunit